MDLGGGGGRGYGEGGGGGRLRKGAPFEPATQAKTCLRPATCVKNFEKACRIEKYQKRESNFQFIFLLAAVTLTVFRVCYFSNSA